MEYKIRFSRNVFKDILYLHKTDVAAYHKLMSLLAEIKKNPREGTGKRELLKYNLKGYYSRRITKKHRLVYTIENDILLIVIVSVYGHYDDK